MLQSCHDYLRHVIDLTFRMPLSQQYSRTRKLGNGHEGTMIRIRRFHYAALLN